LLDTLEFRLDKLLAIIHSKEVLMFYRLFIHLFLVIIVAITFAIVVLDDLYIEGVKKDELSNTRGIDQIVIADIAQFENKTNRLNYWSQRFNYQFSLTPLNEVKLPKNDRSELQANGVFINVESGFAFDAVELFYYHKVCECVLILNKNYGTHDAFQSYLQQFLFIIILALAIYIFYYANGHKKQVNELVKVYQAYGAGEFLVRANTKTPKPYTLLATTFNQMAQQIKLLIEEQRTLVHGVSHDLRTPIARLRFALDMTRNCHSIEEYQALVQDMDLDLDELDTLVDEWLFYAEINGKSANIACEMFDLKKVTEKTASKIQVLFPNIKFDLVLEEAVIEGDERLVARTIENLLINAAKFARSNVRMKIQASEHRQEKTSVCLIVEDDGPGIPEALQQKVVQPFVKLDDSRNSSGFGLGLAIVKSIVEKHQAQLHIKTSTLGGASFSVSFKSYI